MGQDQSSRVCLSWQGLKCELTQRVKRSQQIRTPKILVPVHHARCQVLILGSEGTCQKQWLWPYLTEGVRRKVPPPVGKTVKIHWKNKFFLTSSWDFHQECLLLDEGDEGERSFRCWCRTGCGEAGFQLVMKFYKVYLCKSCLTSPSQGSC